MSEKFWMVLKKDYSDFNNSHMPFQKHSELDEAITEAKRLCVKENKSFIVLEAIKRIQVVNPETEVIEL